MLKIRNSCNILAEKSEDLDADERLILNWILKKWNEKIWTTFIRLRLGTDGRVL